MRILKPVLIGVICVTGVVTGICIVKSRSSTARHRRRARNIQQQVEF